MRHVFLTGQPGVGKTSAVRGVASDVQAAILASSLNASLGGFYTEEVRSAGERSGFDIVTLSGERARLAVLGRDHPRVGKYTVDVASFESLALPALASSKQTPCGIHVIDEVGKMELFSKRFFPAVLSILDDVHGPTVLGTLPILKPGRKISQVEQVSARKDVLVLELTRENRDEVRRELVQVLLEHLARGGCKDCFFNASKLLPFAARL
eukprot:6193812-Pleurochrysis_carterae.AAC.2